MTENKIDVLVIEDSAVTRLFLVHLLESDPQIRVVGAVGDGCVALDFLEKNRPDVVLMDVHMPGGLDGFETTRRIMETKPLPIIICSTVGNDTVFHSLEAGAVACVEKPPGYGHADFEAAAAHLLETVKLMSEVKVIRRWARTQATLAAATAQPVKPLDAQANVKLIGIGTSTGGPPALQTILSGLPKDFPVPVLVVQHIAPGFLPGMAEWLSQTTSLQIRIASPGTLPMPGHVYLAPDDCHMGIDASGRIIVSKQPSENGVRPAVAFLFRSLAQVYGPNALGMLLTGMGQDGAIELRMMKDKGAVTIAQDRESSVVHGMPGAAIALGGATHVLPVNRIADVLATLVRKNNVTSRS